MLLMFFFASRRRHTRCALVTGVQTCALPISDVARALPDWQGKTIIDAMNTNAPVEDLDGLPSTAFASKAFPGARFVKGFNHLLARTLATDPRTEERRVGQECGSQCRTRWSPYH